MPISKKSNKNADNKADSRQNRLTISANENLPSGYVPQAQTQGNLSPTSAMATGASIELTIPIIDLSETPPYALRFGRQNGNDEIFPIIDISQTPQDDNVILVSETNEVVDICSPVRSVVSGQASNNNGRRATRRRRRVLSDLRALFAWNQRCNENRPPQDAVMFTAKAACPLCKATVVPKQLRRIYL
uniref:Uncharacterized protein n=1 Tax=Glossina morsitans morsitans TaxID=37546 RepID=A0A1B0G4S6_GLOMM